VHFGIIPVIRNALFPKLETIYLVKSRNWANTYTV